MMRKCYIQTASLKDNIYCHVLLLLISKCVAVQITFCKIIFLIRKLFLTRNSKAFLKIKGSSEIHFKFSSNPPCGDSRRIYKTPWSKEMLKNNKTITCPKHMELHVINVSRISQIYCDPSKISYLLLYLQFSMIFSMLDIFISLRDSHLWWKKIKRLVMLELI